VCFAHVPVELRKDKTLSARAIKCRVLGVSDEYKGYRLLDVYNNRLIHSRHVMFETQHNAEVVLRAFGKTATSNDAVETPTQSVEDNLTRQQSAHKLNNFKAKRVLVEAMRAAAQPPKRPRGEANGPARFGDYKCFQTQVDKVNTEGKVQNKIPIPRNLREALRGLHRKQ
jgi:hypothetical protein